MARLPSSFNAAQSEKLGDYTAIPSGQYVAQIIKSEMKDTKNGDGKYLQLTYQIIDGEHNGRNVFARLNLINSNVQAVEIATKTLATIAELCGVEIVEDSEQLHGVPMVISVIKKDASGQYPEQNDIKGYSAYDGAAPPASPAAAAPAATKSAPPWAKKK